MKNVACVLLLVTVVSGLCMGQAKVGTTSAPFLGIAVGPRATAMGGAFIGTADDATSLYWNPGGMSRAAKTQFIASYTNWLAGTNFNWFGFMLNLDGTNAVGISLTQLNYGEEEVTRVDMPEGTGEKWDALDLAVGVSYSRSLTDHFSIGGSVKYISQRIWHESASAFAMDVGVLYITPFNDLRLGMSLSNFGTDMTLDGQDLIQQAGTDSRIPVEQQYPNPTIPTKLKVDGWTLPLMFRVGIAMDVIRNGDFRATLGVDALRPNDNAETINAGGEVAWNDMVFIRGGYKSLFRSDSEEGLTLGFGLRYQFVSTAVNVDYAYAKFGMFKDIQSFALGISF
ncbi:MAG: hypothetical protein COS95_04910 [Ignavibacteriales bacterium CG07_land_8_20_14_0_80_59_12]|nr:MAG: hypothetical protein COS95_04910 [Ignavibacteriales bacterium CG07_land_8_20_14_0_80_59_12]